MTELRIGPLVRAVSAESIVIWTEWTDAGNVLLEAYPDAAAKGQADEKVSTSVHTVNVGGHHYALSPLTGLQAATWYCYTVASSSTETEGMAEVSKAPAVAEDALVQCFRTLDLPTAGVALRLAYGSCRNPAAPEPDALSALGPWLKATFAEREQLWPRLLLLIGDQIYADEPKLRTKVSAQTASSDGLPPGAHTFEEFASLYEEAWTSDDGIRQVLAALPTYMIFDDHEITNGWNVAPNWRARAIQKGLEQTLVDGLVAYWVYQGWGNLSAQQEKAHVLLALMQTAAQSGEDVLDALRAWVRQAVNQELVPHWHYEIATTPPIFVADVRADRPAILGKASEAALDAPTRIMSQSQMVELEAWMQQYAATTSVVVSSVPVLLTPVIGLAEYVTGIRPFQQGPLRRLGYALARFQRRLAQRMSFDHWPLYYATWRELVKLLSQRQQDVVVLSGDVHFSYSAQARATLFPTKHGATLYQLVASPFRNTLTSRDTKLILRQSSIKRLLYGGLHIAMLPLLRAKGTAHVPHDLLLQNTVALVTFQPQPAQEGTYTIQQTYLGLQDGNLQEIARTAFKRKDR